MSHPHRRTARSAWLLALLPLQDELAERFTLPAGLEVSVWAESPELYNPTALDVDVHGRIWVTEAVNYRKWGGRNPGREHAGGDRVVILSDTDGDGRCETSKVFVQDPELVAPLGIAVIGERVFVACSPHLFVYVDEDGDDVPDRRETFLSGFGGFDHDHGLHSLVLAPDGSFVFSAGNAGPHIVTDHAGWTLRSGSIYNGGGPALADNKPGLTSDDGRAWTGGLVLRVEPDGTGLGVLAHNFRNNYEVALDSFGNLFQTDNDDDGNQACRTLFCLEGGNHGYFSEDGARTWGADRRPGQDTQAAHWHQDDPGVVPAGCINGAGGPTGCTVYEGDLLAPWIDGAVVNTDAGANVVYAHRTVRSGAGFALERTDLLRPRDESPLRDRRWFRPSDVVVGLDGSLFVADWFDPGVGGHLAGDAEAYGRILRIAPRGAAAAGVVLATGTIEEAVAALASPAVNPRFEARRTLLAGKNTARDALRAKCASERDPRRIARALWLLATPELDDAKTVTSYLAHPEPELRAVALRALQRRAAPASETVRILRAHGLARDPDAGVRREAALALRGVTLEACLDLLLDLAERVDPADRYAVEAFGLATRGKEDELWPELAAELGDAPRNWDARFEALAWRLHPAASIPAFLARALEPSLTPDQRRRAIDALAFRADREAADAVLTIAQAGPEDLRPYAAFWIRQRATNDWRGYGLERAIENGDAAGAELVFQSDVLHTGAIEIDVELGPAELVYLVTTDADDGNSCDWTDWIEPRFVGADSTWKLAEATWLGAESQWGGVNVGKNCAGGPLVVDGTTYDDGIGTHASSTVAWRVPPGAERFRARAGPDAGGTRQNGGRSTSVVFEVRVARPAGPPRDGLWAARMRDESLSLDLRIEAARELALDPRGALRLLRGAQDLAGPLRDAVAETIFRNPDIGIRALASEHFARTDDASPLPSVRALLELQGDARRGRAAFQDRERSQCLACHAYRSGDARIGKDVGPDLTRIREKFGRAELFDAILNPSAAIAFGYDSWVFETQGGFLWSGFLLADGPTVVLKDTQGERVVLPANEIVSRTKQTVSTMPAGVAHELAPQDLADLVAFLTEDPEREPVFGDEVVLFDGGTLDAWTFHLDDPELDLADVWSVEDGELVCRGTPAGYLRTKERFESFLLTLEWRFDPASGGGNSGVLLRRVGADKVWPRSIEAQLQSGHAGDIWNIDAFGLEVDPARTSGRRTTRLQPSSERPLGEWNRYELLLDGSRLELRVNGVLQNTADWCEEVPGEIALQSEGVPIRFRDIRLRPIR